jgi:hypothetical protein
MAAVTPLLHQRLGRSHGLDLCRRSNIHSKPLATLRACTGAGVVLENGQPLTFKTWNTNATTSLGASNGVSLLIPAT